jgi:DNA-binding MarR family transcriptional regulator
MTTPDDDPTAAPAAPSSGGPPAIATSLTALVIGAGRRVQRQLDERLAVDGLSMRHLGALGHLAHQPDLSYSDLGRRAGVTSQSMHATVRQLEDLGAVRREHAGQGHRARLEVTPHGRELLERARAAVERLDAEWFADRAPQDRELLRAALTELALGDLGRG